MVNYDRAIGCGIGIGLSFLVVACAGASFPYHYYPYDIQNHKLVGDTEEHDLSDSVCLSTEVNQKPCTVVLTDDFYQLKADYLKTKSDLIECQKGSSASPQ